MFITLWASVAGMATAVAATFMLMLFCTRNWVGGLTLAVVMALCALWVARDHRRRAPQRAHRHRYYTRLHDMENELKEITGVGCAPVGSYHTPDTHHHGQYLP